MSEVGTEGLRAHRDRRPSECGLGEQLETIGLNLVGVLPIEAYDRSVPAAWRAQQHLLTARTALLIGAGGMALHRSYRSARGSSGLDAFVTRAVASGCAELRAEGWQSVAFGYDEKREDRFVDLIALAQLAGLGAPSRLGLLIHREYGPWLSLRALVLTERRLPATRRGDDFLPCTGCPAPCFDVCPGHAPRPLPAGFDVHACGRQRQLAGPCRLHCHARRACVVGQEHAYDAESEEALMAASLGRFPAPASGGT
jgi:hypothetical protein